jgi:hypothetical protein
MGKFKEMDLLRQEREAFDADYPMEPTPRDDMWIAWNSEDGFTFWDSEYAARLCTATNSIEWPVQYVMQKVNIQTQITKDNLQPAPWVGLTDEEVQSAVLADPIGGAALMSMMRDEVMVADVRQAINIIARAIEAKLKEKNRG